MQTNKINFSVSEHSQRLKRSLSRHHSTGNETIAGAFMSGQPQRGQIAAFPEVFKNLSNDTLVIGNLARWRAEGRVLEPLEGLRFVDISELDATIVNDDGPDIILSPLVADDFDAVDVAVKLIELEFRGRYRAISDDLPDAQLIRKEVRAFAPQLDFDLLLMPRQQPGS